MKLRQPSARSQQGIALIIVMLVILAFTILAAGFAYSMKLETRLARNASFDDEMLWMAHSGVERARWLLAYKLTDPGEAGYDSLSQAWAGGRAGTNEVMQAFEMERVPVGPGTITVRIIDLERTVNINLANREVLLRAFELLGVNAVDAGELADAIDDWKDVDTLTGFNGAESDYYLAQPTPYIAKNGPIDDLSELLQVKGMTTQIYGSVNGARRFATTGAATDERGLRGQDPTSVRAVGLVDLFNTLGRHQVNINTASAEVLQLFPDIDPVMAASIIEQRAGPDGMDGTEDDTPFQSPGELINARGMFPQLVQQLQRFCGVRSFTFEVRIRVEVGATRRDYVALLARGGPRDVQVLAAYWE